MPKVMLLLAAGKASDSPVMRTALAAARLFDGHLQVLHVRRYVPSINADRERVASNGESGRPCRLHSRHFRVHCAKVSDVDRGRCRIGMGPLRDGTSG